VRSAHFYQTHVPKQLILCSKVHRNKVKVVQLANKFPASYGTPTFITVFTRPRYWSLSSARWIRSKPTQCTSLRSTLI